MISLIPPQYRIIAVVLLLGGIYTFGYFKGYAKADRAAEVASLKSQIAAMKIDLQVARNAEKLAEMQTAEAEALAAQNRRIVDELGKDTSCLLSADHARRLRDIRLRR